MVPEQMAAHVKLDYAKFGKLIRMTGVKAELDVAVATCLVTDIVR